MNDINELKVAVQSLALTIGAIPRLQKRAAASSSRLEGTIDSSSPHHPYDAYRPRLRQQSLPVASMSHGISSSSSLPVVINSTDLFDACDSPTSCDGGGQPPGSSASTRRPVSSASTIENSEPAGSVRGGAPTKNEGVPDGNRGKEEGDIAGADAAYDLTRDVTSTLKRRTSSRVRHSNDAKFSQKDDEDTMNEKEQQITAESTMSKKNRQQLGQSADATDQSHAPCKVVLEEPSRTINVTSAHHQAHPTEKEVNGGRDPGRTLSRSPSVVVDAGAIARGGENGVNSSGDQQPSSSNAGGNNGPVAAGNTSAPVDHKPPVGQIAEGAARDVEDPDELLPGDTSRE